MLFDLRMKPRYKAILRVAGFRVQGVKHFMRHIPLTIALFKVFHSWFMRLVNTGWVCILTKAVYAMATTAIIGTENSSGSPVAETKTIK